MILAKRTGIIGSRVSDGNTPIQQIKVAGLTGRNNNSQGLPKPVSNVTVSVQRNGTARVLRISFTHPTNDPYFTTGQAYIQQGTDTPTLLASGSSPITVNLTKSSVPVIITVVSAGNWGATDLKHSPARSVSLV